MSARSWSVTITAPDKWISANGRYHWRRKAAMTKQWRDAAHLYARQAKLPKLGKAHITATLHFPDRRKRDAANYGLTVKAIVDGLVDHGLLDDDSDEYLIGPDLRTGPPGGNRVVLTIREVSP